MLGLILLIFLAYRGHSIVWVAPFCGGLVALLSGVDLLQAYLGDYVSGTAAYVVSWFPAFFLGAQYLAKAAEIGLNPEYLHRIASIASGGLDTLPHNGAVLTLLAVSNCKHKESYMDICVTSCIIPVVVSLVLAFVWGLFI